MSQQDANLKLMIETNKVNWGIEQIQENRWYGILANNHNISKQDVKYVHSQGVRIAVFDIKTQSNQVKAVNKHPDFIITDNIPQLQQIVYN